jgi:hypothetical protein
MGAATYTDAPPLQSNLLTSSFRLLFWLFFHPTAWQKHLERLDPTLRPDFSLSEIQPHQFRNGELWRTVLRLYVAWPLLCTAVLLLTLRAFNLPNATILVGLVIGIASGVVASLGVTIAGSVVLGVPMGIGMSLIVGTLGSFLVTNPVGQQVLLLGQFQPTAAQLETAVIGLAGGLSGGLAFGVAEGIVRTTPLLTTHSQLRQISGVLIGIILGVSGGLLASGLQDTFAPGLLLGVPFALAVGWRAKSWRRGMLAGLLIGLAGAFLRSTPLDGGIGLIRPFALIALLIALFAVPYTFAERLAGPSAGALAGALGSSAGFFLFLGNETTLLEAGSFTLTGILLGLTLGWWRPVLLYPLLLIWNIGLYQLDERRLVAGKNGRLSLFHRHSAFWDELQRLPLLNLDDHLRLVMQHRPAEAAAAVNYLINSNQRWAAQAALIEQDAQRLQACQSVDEISRVHQSLGAGELAGPASALLRSFRRLSEDVVAAQQQESAFNQRLALKAVEDRIDSLLRELTRSDEPYAVQFQPVAEQWRQVVSTAVSTLSEEAELRQEIDSPYIIGVPLTERQEIFIGRTDISSRIEQLILDRRQPPLLLYGQRRVGKTSLLNNMGRLLPSTIVPLFVDMQGPATRAKDEAGFLYNMARSMVRSARRHRRLDLPKLTRDDLLDDPFTRFEDWLDDVEAVLGEQVALLMLDEFEVLEQSFENGRFDETVILGMIRYLIQHRLNFKVMLSGSHTLEGFHRWSSYLINVQVIHVGYLSEVEARQLVVAPVRGFALRYDPDAVDQIIRTTRGHPFLLQLLCAEVVAHKNEQPPAQRRLATLSDVEIGVQQALAHGSFFFADIETNQLDMVSTEVLRLIAQAGPFGVASRQSLVDYFPSLLSLEEALTSLQNRELIEPHGAGYRFQVELIRRWFGQ